MDSTFSNCGFGNAKSAIRNLKSAVLTGALLFALCLPVSAQQSAKIPRIGNFCAADWEAAGTAQGSGSADSRLAVLANSGAAGSPLQLRETKLASEALGLDLQHLEVGDTEDFEKLFQAARTQRADALIALDDAFMFTHRARIVNLAAKNRLPAIYGFAEFVEAGGLMSYAANLSDMYRRTATYVDKILKGAKPAELPVEQPKKFEFIISSKAARQIGLTIPVRVLERADKVIR